VLQEEGGGSYFYEVEIEVVYEIELNFEYQEEGNVDCAGLGNEKEAEKIV
jgi:hypothetical protein